MSVVRRPLLSTLNSQLSTYHPMDWWRHHPKALSERECADIITRALTYPAAAATIGHGGAKPASVDHSIRQSTIRWIKREDRVLGWLMLRLERLAHESNRDAFGLDLAGQCGGFTDIQFTEYHAPQSALEGTAPSVLTAPAAEPPNESGPRAAALNPQPSTLNSIPGAAGDRYDWHEDNAWKGRTPFDRKLSLVAQLSRPEDYQGGRLELHNDPLPDTHFRGQGDIIVFPAFNRHRVTPVTAGTRYSLVTWFVGPRLR